MCFHSLPAIGTGCRLFRISLTGSIDPHLVLRGYIDMNQVKLSPKFQIVIPKEIREQIGLKVGMKLEIIPFGNRIELIPIESIKNLRGILKGMNTNSLREDDRL